MIKVTAVDLEAMKRVTASSCGIARERGPDGGPVAIADSPLYAREDLTGPLREIDLSFDEPGAKEARDAIEAQHQVECVTWEDLYAGAALHADNIEDDDWRENVKTVPADAAPPLPFLQPETVAACVAFAVRPEGTSGHTEGQLYGIHQTNIKPWLRLRPDVLNHIAAKMGYSAAWVVEVVAVRTWPEVWAEVAAEAEANPEVTPALLERVLAVVRGEVMKLANLRIDKLLAETVLKMVVLLVSEERVLLNWLDDTFGGTNRSTLKGLALQQDALLAKVEAKLGMPREELEARLVISYDIGGLLAEAQEVAAEHLKGNNLEDTLVVLQRAQVPEGKLGTLPKAEQLAMTAAYAASKVGAMLTKVAALFGRGGSAMSKIKPLLHRFTWLGDAAVQHLAGITREGLNWRMHIERKATKENGGGKQKAADGAGGSSGQRPKKGKK